MDQPPPPPPPPPSGGRRTKPVVKEATKAVTEEEWRPMCIEPPVEWRKAVRLRRSESGSCGVFFVTFVGGWTLVVKGSQDVPCELFGSLLGRALLGPSGLVSFPAVRVVDYSAPSESGPNEWRTIKNALASLASRGGGEAEVVKVKKELKRAFFLVMGLAQGTAISSLGEPLARSLLGGLVAQKHSWQLTSPEEAERDVRSKRALRGLGALMAFDALVNNGDRLPLLWGNEGNGRNVFAEADTGGIVAIDNVCKCIPKGPFRQRFLASLGSFVRSISKDPQREAPETARVRGMLTLDTGFDVGPEGATQIQLGFLEGAGAIVRALRADPGLVDDLKDKVKGMIKIDWADVWASGLSLVSTDFMHEVVQVFSAASPEDVVSQWPVSRNAVSFNLTSDGTARPGPATVLVLQKAVGLDEPSLLRTTLSGWAPCAGPRPNFVVYPELSLPSAAGFRAGLDNPLIAQFADVAKEFSCHVLVCLEEHDGPSRYNSAVLIGEDGAVLGKYRKQRPVSPLRHKAGSGPLVVDTRFGRVGVLICFDAEQADVLDATLELKPFMILNPTCICPPWSSAPTSEVERHRLWVVAVDSMRRKLEHVSGNSMATIVRCDLPADEGACGSSQVVGPFSTVLARGPGECCLVARVETNTSGFWGAFSCAVPSRGRTAKEDNTGLRYLATELSLPPCKWPWERSALCLAGSGAFLTAVVPSHGVCTWDLAARALLWCASDPGYTAAHAVCDTSVLLVRDDGSVVLHDVSTPLPPSSAVSCGKVRSSALLSRASVLSVDGELATLSTAEHMNRLPSSSWKRPLLVGRLAASCEPAVLVCDDVDVCLLEPDARATVCSRVTAASRVVDVAVDCGGDHVLCAVCTGELYDIPLRARVLGPPSLLSSTGPSSMRSITTILPTSKPGHFMCFSAGSAGGGLHFVATDYALGKVRVVRTMNVGSGTILSAACSGSEVACLAANPQASVSTATLRVYSFTSNNFKATISDSL